MFHSFSYVSCYFLYRAQGQKPQVKLVLSEAIMCIQEKGEEVIPKEHTLNVSTIIAQTLGVFSQFTCNISFFYDLHK